MSFEIFLSEKFGLEKNIMLGFPNFLQDSFKQGVIKQTVTEMENKSAALLTDSICSTLIKFEFETLCNYL